MARSCLQSSTTPASGAVRVISALSLNRPTSAASSSLRVAPQPVPGNRRLVFVGERRSRKARELNASWTNGGLAAHTLHAALRACSIDPNTVLFLNLFEEGDGAWVVDAVTLEQVRTLASERAAVIALGWVVQRTLARYGISSVPLTHPAARGRIRTRAVYQAHVAEVLAQVA